MSDSEDNKTEKDYLELGEVFKDTIKKKIIIFKIKFFLFIIYSSFSLLFNLSKYPLISALINSKLNTKKDRDGFSCNTSLKNVSPILTT